jgi:predicted nucleotidyltransferase
LPVAVRAPKRADLLSTVLASGALARLVTHFALRPDETPHTRALQRATGLTSRSLQTELARLDRLGVIRREVSGRHVRYVPNEHSPRWRLLRELVRELADPTDLVRDALSDVPGLEAAFVFGSMARGTEIREGSDIDLFVLRGDLAEDRLARRTIDAGVLLKREVNPVVMGAEELRDHLSKESGFLRAILNEPKRWVVGDEGTLHSALALQEK